MGNINLSGGLVRRRLLLSAVTLAAIVALAATIVLAPGGGSARAASKATTAAEAPGTFTWSASETGPNVPGFFPFTTSSNPYFDGAISMVYEPVLMYNVNNPSQIYPWLASAYKWSDAGKTLTLTIPKGRTWSDGKPLTASDVAFTYNLVQKYPTLDVAGVIGLNGATAPSPTQAVLHFKSPAYGQMFEITLVPIVPAHIWSKLPDPTKYVDTNPVGSGPFLLQSITPEEMTLVKNPHYWQHGLPKINTVHIPVYTSTNPAVEALSSGQLDWAGYWLANPQKEWSSLNPNFKTWIDTIGDVDVCPNTRVAPLNNATVRRAIALSFNRQQDVPEVEHQYYAVVDNPTGLRDTWKSWIPAKYQGQKLTYQPTKVRQMLLSAGFKKGKDGFLALPNGKPFKLALMLPSQYTDFMEIGTLMVNQMKRAGIDASLDGVSMNAWSSNTATGNYQISMCAVWESVSPYTTYNGFLNGALTAPIGKTAASNFSGWNDPATNAALKAFNNTNNLTTQKAEVAKIATTVATQDPMIPLMAVGSFGQYNTTRWTGFPDAAHPYQTNSGTTPFPEMVLLHLRPKK
jgi:peptide/nickel transport system substrate-binding protein